MKDLKGKIDLHIHTTASDGTWEPEYIAELAAKSGISLISITDHDETANIRKGEKAAAENGLNYLRGVEISSVMDGEVFHILGYGVDLDNRDFIDLIDNNRYLLQKKDDDFVKDLIKMGYNININDYEAYEHKSSRGGWKALSFLIDAGLCKDAADFFNNLFLKAGEMSQPDFPDAFNVINIIKKAGGVPILAHPYYTPSEVPVEQRLSTFYKLGVLGFECYHPNHNKKIIKECVDWCRKNNTIITAGSDCHGTFILTRHLGEPAAYIDDLNLGILDDFII